MKDRRPIWLPPALSNGLISNGQPYRLRRYAARPPSIAVVDPPRTRLPRGGWADVEVLKTAKDQGRAAVRSNGSRSGPKIAAPRTALGSHFGSPLPMIDKVWNFVSQDVHLLVSHDSGRVEHDGPHPSPGVLLMERRARGDAHRAGVK